MIVPLMAASVAVVLQAAILWTIHFGSVSGGRLLWRRAHWRWGSHGGAVVAETHGTASGPCHVLEGVEATLTAATTLCSHHRCATPRDTMHMARTLSADGLHVCLCHWSRSATMVYTARAFRVISSCCKSPAMAIPRAAVRAAIHLPAFGTCAGAPSSLRQPHGLPAPRWRLASGSRLLWPSAPTCTIQLVR